MVYLVLAILASFSITLLIKDNESQAINTRVVLAGNYLTAAALGWLFVLLQGPAYRHMSRTTLLLGLGGGLLWPGAFFLLMWGIRHYGVSLAGSVSRLSLTIPVLFAVIFLNERLALSTVLGVAGAFVAFVLLRPAQSCVATRDHIDRQALWYFPALVFVFGLVDLWANLFTTTAPVAEKPLFMALIFTTSAILVWLTLGVHHLRVRRTALIRGLLLGVPNFFSTYFLMESLRSPVFAGLSTVVYALYSVVGVVLAFLAGALIWKEELSRRNQVGVVVAVIAVALLNLVG